MIYVLKFNLNYSIENENKEEIIIKYMIPILIKENNYYFIEDGKIKSKSIENLKINKKLNQFIGRRLKCKSNKMMFPKGFFPSNKN